MNDRPVNANPDALLQPDPVTLPAPQPPSASNPSLRRIFLGPDGLRAFWSLLIFIALMAPLLWGAHRLLRTLYPQFADPSANLPIPFALGVLGEGSGFLSVLFVTWIMSKIERRPNSVYGLGGPRRFSRFFGGLAWGIGCLSLLILVLWKSGFLIIDSRLLFGADIVRYGVMWLFGFLLVGLLEEYLTRGFLLYTLSRGLAGIYAWAFKTRHSTTLGFWTAAVALSILFGLDHGSNPGESPIGLLSAGLASMIFCFSLWRTGSLWWAIGFHTAWDWGQSFLYGVADSGVMVEHHLFATHPLGKPILSGGTTGPEGSVFILAILTFIALIILFTLPRNPESYAAKLPAHGLAA